MFYSCLGLSFNMFSDSLIINLSGKLQILEDSDLLITSTTTADSGKYTCVRANDAGNVSGEAYLTVLGKNFVCYDR